MPQVEQQKVVVKKPTPTVSGGTDSVLDRIALVKTKVDSVMMSLYGQPKTGKTRLAATFPKPVLIIGAEDGTSSVIGAKDVYFVHLKRTAEMHDIVNGPVSAGKFKTIVVDNGTKLRDMRIAEILGLKIGDTTAQVDHKGWGFATREQWGECSMTLKSLLRPLLDVCRRKKFNMVAIAHEQNFNEDTKADGLAPNVGPALGKAVCDWLNAECDYIGQTLIRPQMRERLSKVGTKEVRTMEATGKKEYCLRVGPHETYQTGFRIGLMNSLPEDVDFLVNPTYDKIVALIEGRYDPKKP